MARIAAWARIFAALTLAVSVAACGDATPPFASSTAESAAAAPRETRDASPGFTSRRSLEEHFAKHGELFGPISQDEYLDLARQLRDAPVGGPVLEAVRDDGVVTRFDRATGRFGAYNTDGTIRTFFIPNDGERYFRRQARRPAS